MDGLLSMGRTASSCFILKKVFTPSIYLSWLVVVHKKANWWEFNFRYIGIGYKCHKQQISTCAEVCSLCFFGRSFLALFNNYVFKIKKFNKINLPKKNPQIKKDSFCYEDFEKVTKFPYYLLRIQRVYSYCQLFCFNNLKGSVVCKCLCILPLQQCS